MKSWRALEAPYAPPGSTGNNLQPLLRMLPPSAMGACHLPALARYLCQGWDCNTADLLKTSVACSKGFVYCMTNILWCRFAHKPLHKPLQRLAKYHSNKGAAQSESAFLELSPWLLFIVATVLIPRRPFFGTLHPHQRFMGLG
jgi:hypothetical protein